MEQLTLIKEEFRVIILVDKNFVYNCDLAFLNRFEKIVLSFDKILDNDINRISKYLIEEIKLRRIINKYKDINYSLRDLLINCGDEDIQALIYYFSIKSKKEENEDNEENGIDEEKIIENVINKIYKILPQDIICILNENNIIKEYYYSNPIFYNYEDYINDEEFEKYKISIIYTFTSITNATKGLNKDMRFMVSEIRSEDGLKLSIDKIKEKNESNKSEKEKEYNICIDFEQFNSNKIKFISNFILNNFKYDKYNYIFIIHIKRNFNHSNNERLYSLPDINPSINQMFIDNLNGNNRIILKDILERDIKDILIYYEDIMNLKEEFNKILKNTLTRELSEKDYDDNMIDDYITELLNFMNEEEIIKNKIIEAAFNLIDNNKDQEKNCKDIIDKFYKEDIINIYTIDIASCLIEYIKNLFNDYLKKVLEKLEDNNILTTLIEFKKKDFKEIDKHLVEEITLQYLDEITTGENEAKSESKLFVKNNPFSKFLKK